MLSTDQLFIAAGIIVGIASVYSVQIIRTNYSRIKAMLDNNKEYRRLQSDVKEYKKQGNLHSWVTLPVKTKEGLRETNVCQETGYCPAVEGFIPIGQVKHMIEMKSQGERYEAFRKEERNRLQLKYDLKNSEIDGLISDIHSIKKNFHIKLMDESIASLKEKLGPNVQVITSLDDLEEAMKNGKNS